MKTVASLAEARKMALRNGAALEFEGATFNSGMTRSAGQEPKPAPAATAPTAHAAPLPTPGLSREDVERMLAARDQMWRGQIELLSSALDESLLALKAVPAPPRLKKFNVTYDANGRVDVVVPIYEK